MKLPRREYHQPPPRAVPFRSVPVLPQRYWRQLPASPRRTIPTTRYAMLDMGLTTLASDLSSFFDRRNHHTCQRHHSEDPESFPQEHSRDLLPGFGPLRQRDDASQLEVRDRLIEANTFGGIILGARLVRSLEAVGEPIEPSQRTEIGQP